MDEYNIDGYDFVDSNFVDTRTRITGRTMFPYLVVYFFTFCMILILILAIAGVFESKTSKFTNMNFPQIKDAKSSGIYTTNGRECKYYKCKSRDRYWCSKDKSCFIPQHNLQGQLFVPQNWFDRFV
jgi:hypothetical protein